MLNDPKIWGTHLKRREVVMITGWQINHISHFNVQSEEFNVQHNKVQCSVKGFLIDLFLLEYVPVGLFESWNSGDLVGPVCRNACKFCVEV